MKHIAFILAIGWVMGWYSHDLMATKPLEEQYPNLKGETLNPSPQRPLTETASVIPTIISKAGVVPMPAPLPQTASIPLDPLQTFTTLLMQESFSAAFSAWPQQSSEQARNQIIMLSNTYIQQGMSETALLLLKQYRNHFPDDVAAGLLQAKTLHEQEQFDLEAFLLIDLLKQTANPELISRINHQRYKAVQAQKEHLIQAEEFNHILTFYRRLSNMDGANTDYQLMQAIALIEMGHTKQATTILQPLVYDPEVGNRASALLQKIEQIHSIDYQVTIPLQRAGEHFLVPLSINGNPPVFLLLDTGASLTLMQVDQTEIDTSHALPQISLQTVSGKIDAPLKLADHVKLGSFQLNKIKIALITQSVAPHAQGLLGMNILKHFDFYIDQQTPSLKLSLRSSQSANKNL